MMRRVFQHSVRPVGFLLAVVIVLTGVLLPTAVQAAPATSAPSSPAYSVYYTVRPGDTLSGIARYYGTTVSAIMAANGLYSTTIYVGQVLCIPTGFRQFRRLLLFAVLHRAARRHAVGHCVLVWRELLRPGTGQRDLKSQPYLCWPATVYSQRVWISSGPASAARTRDGMWPVLHRAARR